MNKVAVHLCHTSWNRRTVNEFSLKNLVYNINQIKFALDSRADRRDRSFFKAKWFIL